jgi:hypothetical protein
MKTIRLTIIITALCFLLSCVAYDKELPVSSPKDVGMSPERLAQIKPAVLALVDDEKIAEEVRCLPTSSSPNQCRLQRSDIHFHRSPIGFFIKHLLTVLPDSRHSLAVLPSDRRTGT